MRFAFAVLLLAAGMLSEQTRDDALDFDKADLEVVRLTPSKFPQLPSAIRRELDRRGCTIPQLWTARKPGNAVQGSFIKPDEVDWAILCSILRTSTILIFRNELTSHVIQLAPEPDSNKLQGVGGNRIGYSRAIDPVGRAYILEHYQAYGGQKPPPINHQGLNDAFVGKASVVHYFYRGKWLQLAGAD